MGDHLTDVRRYRVDEVLGRGGFGTVYRARLEGRDAFRRTVALKVLHRGLEAVSEAARRLRDEARLLGLVRHRAIVQVDGLVRLGGRQAVVMEYVEGVDLRRILVDGAVPPGVALDIVGEVASALRAGFEAVAGDGRPLRLLHRDVKPANVQVTPAGEVKLLDFGIARAEFADRECRTQQLFYGSPPYLSPERLEFEDTHAGDVYALGVVLYELLTAEGFGETTCDETEHEEKVHQALRRVRKTTRDPKLLALLHDCLAFDPAERPTARDVERRAREVRRGLDDPWLSDWAELFVPALLSRRQPVEDDLCGEILVEEARVPDVTSTLARPGPGRPAWQLALVAALATVTAALAVSAAVSALWWLLSGSI